MSVNHWAVYRLDYSGNEFLVERGLSQAKADELVLEFESRKHHQHYWAGRLPKTPIDYTKMLRNSLRAGSTLQSTLGVLRNQKATDRDCINAVIEVLGVDAAHATRTVRKRESYWEGSMNGSGDVSK